MSDTLNTEGAARFLGVSEASVRRWSDLGILAVQRVGRRGARRFAREELDRFSKRDATPAARHRQDAVAIGALQLPLHSHLATFYDSDASRLRLSVPFLRDGLLARQPCFLVATGEIRERYLSALNEATGGAADEALAQGRLLILPGVGPRVEDALAVWEEGFWRAVNGGARLLRVVGEMESERQVFESDAEMIAYEFAVNALTERFPCVVLCQYDVRRFDGTTILGALKAHPDLLENRLADCVL